MRIVLFVHSLLSDWNHGNAHFLRGVVTELQSRGHHVRVFEPRDGWSATNLIAEHGTAALAATRIAYPALEAIRYDPYRLDLGRALAGVDLVLVHEWNALELVRRIGEHHRMNKEYVLLFHDTHHRSTSDAPSMAAYDLTHYDGVLAFGDVVRRRYQAAGWAAQGWTWHEAADTRVFQPRPGITRDREIVWIGNWGDEERTAELREFLIEPVRQLGIIGHVYGVRYPESAIEELRDAGLEYQGWLPNYRVPEVFARHRVTVHVPRRPYVQSLPGIPTIRPFEALACGIPLVSAHWDDTERLFEPDVDYLVAHDGSEMRRHLAAILEHEPLARSLAAHGRATVLAHHTCAHRVNELLAIHAQISYCRTERAMTA